MIRRRPSFEGTVGMYKVLVDVLRRCEESGESDEHLLSLTESIALYAAQNHPGLFYDGAVENVAVRAGLRLPDSLPAVQAWLDAALAEMKKVEVLHVATSIPEVGGHARLLENWIKLDPRSAAVLLLANGEKDLPKRLLDAVDGRGGRVFVVPTGAGRVGSAIALRQLARNRASSVVLHVNPHDAIHVAALADENLPPVAYVNHADHAFWLGCSVADLVLDIRESGHKVTVERRQARRAEILGVPLDDADVSVERGGVRRMLGIDEHERLIVSVGSSHKYAPKHGFDFFRTMHQLLTRHANTRVCVIGTTQAEAAAFSRFGNHPRMTFEGVQPDMSRWLAAADLYVEGWPMGSLTALLEAGIAGVCVVPAPSLFADVLVSDDPCLPKRTSGADEAKHIELIDELLGDENLRRERAISEQRALIASHCGDGWRQAMEGLLRAQSGTEHRSHAIPLAVPSHTEFDRKLNRFHIAMKPQPAAGVTKLLKRNTWLPASGMRRITRVALRHGAAWREAGRMHLLYAKRCARSVRTALTGT